MSELKKNNTTYTDRMDKIHETENGEITCCGKEMRMKWHIDGVDFFGFTYVCECGNVIDIHCNREKPIDIE